MIAIRRARASDAAAIGALHVAVWRSTYAGILPDAYLAGLSATRIAASYQRDMFDRRGGQDQLSLIAFPWPPSVATWLENAQASGAGAVAASSVSIGSHNRAICSTAWPPTRVWPRATTRPPRWR